MRRHVSALLAIASVPLIVNAGGPAARPSTGQGDPKNLLSFASGTIVRSYTPGLTSVETIADNGGGLDEGVKGPVQVVWELPGVATLSSLTLTLDDESKGTVAASTTSATDGFRDLGTAQGTQQATGTKIAGAAGTKARWIRVTATIASTSPPISRFVATGTIAPRPPTAPPITGDYWAYGAKLHANGRVLAKPSDEKPARLEVTQIADSINGLQCTVSGFDSGYPGKLTGRAWSYQTEYAGNQTSGTLIVNDESTVIVGTDENAVAMIAFVRASGGPLPEYCGTKKFGTGPSNTLVLQSPHWDDPYPGAEAETRVQFKNVSLTFAGASLLTPTLLSGTDTVVLNGLCRPAFLLNGAQTAALMQWVQAGRKLLIMDSDMCGESVSYDFLPYKFKSNNPGAQGAEGHVLVVVENDSLGTAEKADASHFVDAPAYVKDANQQLGDANTVVTQDDHWCGHLFGVNANGANGFMQMYAPFGKGLIIYDGFDHDDAGVPVYQAIRRLEFSEPVPSDLPCSRRVDMGFVIVADEARTFVPGKAETISVPMHVYSNRGWNGHVSLTATGDFSATVSPAAVDLPPSDRPLSIAVNVPATAQAGHFAVTVKGNGGNQTAQATISFASVATSTALKTALDASCKVPVYGVNFDFNKTTLRPDAEPVLQQILALFKNDPALAAEIGGHTDNVGTPAYNQTLSAGRAETVKTWLAAHGIEASRLTTRGYGETVPIVPNDSEANRAKNRRVELKKPDCK